MSDQADERDRCPYMMTYRRANSGRFDSWRCILPAGHGYDHHAATSYGRPTRHWYSMDLVYHREDTDQETLWRSD
jgi:hypothetical protein